MSDYTGLSPSLASRSRELRRHLAKSILYKLQLGPEPDFKFELLPLHSPLLGQSLLVSFPPLIDMLKFSGYSYLIRGQPWVKDGALTAGAPPNALSEIMNYYARGCSEPATSFQGLRQPQGPNTKPGLRVEMTLEQACPAEYCRAQCAFKDSMIH